jgi:carbon storage regulator CsrA
MRVVLSRCLNAKPVPPGSGITVQVLGIRCGAVRLGVAAPPEVSAFRHELASERRRKGPDPCAR